MDDQEFSMIYLPRKIIEEAMKRGYDIESLVIDSIVEKLRIDPEEEVAIHIELAERYLDEARRYIDRGDPVQASEKLYKVAEECIKALAIELRTPEVEEAKREGRWWVKLLARAAERIAMLLNKAVIQHGWSVAYNLHVWGFHEASLDMDAIKVSPPTIEYLVVETKKIIQDRGTSHELLPIFMLPDPIKTREENLVNAKSNRTETPRDL